MFCLNKKAATVVLLLFTYLLFSQTYSLRIDAGGLKNLSTSFSFINDTFYIPTIFYETVTPSLTFSTGLMQVKSDGTVISKKRFKRPTESLQQGNGLVKINQKYYSTSTANDGTHQKMAFYVFNSASDTALIKIYPGDTSYYFYGNDIKQSLTNKNQLILFGATDSTCGTGHPGHYKFISRTIDTLGNVVSNKIIANSCAYRNLYNSDTTKNKGYILSGFEQQSVWGWGPNYVVKLDSNLNVIWQNYYDTANSVTQAILTLKSGNHILAYSDLDSIVSNFLFWSKIALMKLNENGGLMWQKQFGNLTRNSTATNVKELSNGDLIVCGVTDVNTGNINHPTQLYGFLMRTDSVGNEKWLQTYNVCPLGDTIGQNYLYDVLPMSDGGFAAVGFWAGGDSTGGGEDTWLLRVDSMGCLITGCNAASILDQPSSNNLELNAYPNPFKDELNIVTSFPNGFNEAQIQLIELATGKILMERPATINKQIITFNTKELAAGVYLVGIKGKNITPHYIKVVNIK